MSVVVPQTGFITRPEEAVEMLSELIEDNAERLGIGFIGKYDERLLPSYPAVVISSAPLSREVHATHTFALTLRALIWIYHAKVSLTHKERSEEDLLLVTALVSLLHDDTTYDGHVIFGFVDSEVPGIVAPRAGRGDPIVGTRISWEGVVQERFA
jgi:hypothetical protein